MKTLYLYPLHNYEAAYKKKHSGKLLWVSCKADSAKDADIIMDNFVAAEHNNEGYRRYAGALLIKPNNIQSF